MNIPSLPRPHALRLAAPVAIAALAITACDVDLSLDDLDGSGDRATETVAVDTFTSIEVSDAFSLDVDIDPDASPSVEIDTDDNLVDRVDVFVRDGVLHIREADGRDLDPTIAEVRVVVRTLDGLVGTGAGTIDITGLDTEQFSLELEGARLVDLEGTVDALSIEASGATVIDASDLTAREIELDLSGATGVDVFATERVTGSTSGAVGVMVRGDAEVDLDTSGFSYVEHE